MPGGFTPSRLVLARKRRGWTKKALAARTQLSSKILWAYEAGAKEPSDDTLELLAGALGFPIGFFSRPDSDELPIVGSSFRALSRTTATKRDQALSAGQLAIELSDWIQERFTLPTPSIPRYRGIDPETAAEAVRSEWGLGQTPIRNLIHLLESHGARIFSLPEETRDIDAFSVWRSEVPYIFLNTVKSAEHGRMDAAHELGHLVLHLSHDTPHGRDEEHEAQTFGAAFLMPQASVVAEAPRSGRLDELIASKHRWNVSLSNLVVRMHQIGLLTDWQYRSLFIEIGSKGYRQNEPSAIHREASQVLAKVFHMLRQEGTKRVDVAKELQIPIGELNKIIFGLVITGLDGTGASPNEEIGADRRILKVVQ